MLLSGQVALVTGGAGDLGRAYCLGLAAEGASVVVADINRQKAEQVASEIVDKGGAALPWDCDVTSAASVEEMIHGVVSEYGKLDVLCNHAGVTGNAPVAEMTEEEWDRVITVNLKGAFLVARAGVRQMLRQESGSLIFTVSGLGIQGRVGGAHYAASKGGMIALLRSMAAELRGTGVRVNGVSPGPTDTAMSRDWRDPDEQAKRLASGEVGQPEDIVGTVVFFASDLSKDLTGQVILRNYRG